jgi:hypothetical protein
MSKTNVGLGAIYDGGLTPGLMIGSGRHGRGIMDIINKGHELLKKHKVISKIGEMAGKAGYGRRRRRHGGRRKRGILRGGSKSRRH